MSGFVTARGRGANASLREPAALPGRKSARNFSGVVTPVAIYIVAICLAGAVVAGAAFVWAALRGEFADTAQAAFLVFDDDDESPSRPCTSPEAPR